MNGFSHSKSTTFRTTLLLCALAIATGCQTTNKTPPASSSSAPVDVARNTERARTLTDQAVDQIQKQNFSSAEPLLKSAIEADPMYGPAHNDLGLVDYHLNRLYEAAWELENASKLMPHSAEPHNNLGLVLENAGRYDEAMESYTAATEINPENPEYLGNLARVRIRLDLKDEQTRQILQSLIARDDRSQWRDWERLALIRVNSAIAARNAATEPTTEPVMAPPATQPAAMGDPE